MARWGTRTARGHSAPLLYCGLSTGTAPSFSAVGTDGRATRPRTLENHAIRANLGTLAVLCLLAASGAAAAAADCPLFSAPLESTAGVADNGGTVNGSVSFTPAVVGNGACFGAGEDVSYPGSIFNAGTGSVSFWFKRDIGSGKGGILEIGTLGTPNSLGIFYNTIDLDVTLFVELRTDVPPRQISAANVLPDSSYVHIAVTWEDRGGNVVAKLFVDGGYVDFMSVTGSFAPSGGELVVGKAGVFPWYGSAIGCIDELAFFDFPMLDSEAYAEYVVSDDRQDPQPSARPVSTGPVKIVDGSLEVNGELFVIKGMGYQPIPIGSGVPNTAIYSDACILDRDIPLIRAMNANTIRLWATLPITETLLDRLWNGGVDPIYAIMSFWINATLDFSNAGIRATLESDFRDFVGAFKDHPAVLAWAIGNEVNFGVTVAHSHWYSLANALAAVAHDEEGSSYHPTLIVNGGLSHLGDTLHGSDDVSLSDVDLWGINAYFGGDDQCYFDYYGRLSSKPVLITEFGVDAYDNKVPGVDEQAQADWDVLQWRIIEAKTLGGTVMEYSDEWWKAGNPESHDSGGFVRDAMNDRFSNEEYWGLVSIGDSGGSCNDVTPRLAYTALQGQWMTATPGDSVDYYKVYSLQPEPMPPLPVHLKDQFGEGPVDLTNFGKLGAPVSKAIAPNPPSGVLLRPFEHLTWYEFFEPQTPLFARVKNQFTSENKGALWVVGDGHFLLVPAIKDGLGAIQLGQHWKCYAATEHVVAFRPAVDVNLLDQFHLESDVAVGPGRYLCNPTEKNFEGSPPLPEEHLACYDIADLPLNQLHSLDDQFGFHPDLLVEDPELLCVPSLKFVPEPGVLVSFGSGLMLLGWLDRRRKRSVR